MAAAGVRVAHIAAARAARRDGRRITISIVSHGHGELIAELLADLDRVRSHDVVVLLTVNIPETLSFTEDSFGFPLRILRNEVVRGFADNHNRAAALVDSEFYCVCNPDVRLSEDPFEPLLETLESKAVGVAGPAVFDSAGALQDHARHFPTVRSLLRKAIRWSPEPEYFDYQGEYEPDWIAGMFMVFRTSSFRRVGGFDERYFLYYEDVDICARLRATGARIVVNPNSAIIHDASRRSWQHPYYTLLHLRSMVRFLGADPRRSRAALARAGGIDQAARRG